MSTSDRLSEGSCVEMPDCDVSKPIAFLASLTLRSEVDQTVGDGVGPVPKYTGHNATAALRRCAAIDCNRLINIAADLCNATMALCLVYLFLICSLRYLFSTVLA